MVYPVCPIVNDTSQPYRIVVDNNRRKINKGSFGCLTNHTWLGNRGARVNSPLYLSALRANIGERRFYLCLPLGRVFSLWSECE